MKSDVAKDAARRGGGGAGPWVVPPVHTAKNLAKSSSDPTGDRMSTESQNATDYIGI